MGSMTTYSEELLSEGLSQSDQVQFIEGVESESYQPSEEESKD